MDTSKIFILIITACNIYLATTACTPGWTQAGDYCYNILNVATGNFFTVFRECAKVYGIMPVFYVQKDYQDFTQYWVSKGNQTLAFGYRRYNSSSSLNGTNAFISAYDGRPMIYTNWNTGEPNNWGDDEYCVNIGQFGPVWNDYPCGISAYTPYCQQSKINDNSLTTFFCSSLCRAKGNGHRFTTAPNCTDGGFTLENAAVAYGATIHVPNLTEAIFEMVNSSGNTVMAYGQANRRALEIKGYEIRSLFFVPITLLANGISNFVLMQNSATAPSDSLILLNGSSEHASVTNIGWTAVGSFYLFQSHAQRNGICSLAKDCDWNDWQPWYGCTVTCNGGTRFRNRTKRVVEMKGGWCSNNYTDSEICNTNPCPIPCVWSNWEEWSECSTTCGDGLRNRNRSKIAEELYGGYCSNNYTDSNICNIIPCPIPCTWSIWTEWSECSVDCGGGQSNRSRSKIVEELYGGYCDNIDYNKKNCNKQQCPAAPNYMFRAFECVFLVVSLAVTFCLFLAFKVFTLERAIHMCQELSLFIAHLLISIFAWRSQTERINDALCRPVSVALQYFFLVYFCFVLLECMQTYCIVTNVVSYKDFLKLVYILIIGWGIPAIITGTMAAFFYNNYDTEHSCWLNWGNNIISASTLVPVLAFSHISVIFMEAGGMQMDQPLPLLHIDKYTAALVSRASMVILIPLNFAAWLIGSMAVYHNNIYAHATVAALNVSVGIAIFKFHVAANEEVHHFIRRRFLPCISDERKNLLEKYRHSKLSKARKII